MQSTSRPGSNPSSRYHEALAIQRSLNDKEGSAMSFSGLARLASSSGNLPKAIDLYRQSLEAFEAIGHRFGEAQILEEMAWTHLAGGDAVAARQFFLDSVLAYTDVGTVRRVGTSMAGLAAIEAVEGRPWRAVQIAAAAESFTEQEGITKVYAEGAPELEYVERARAQLSQDAIESATEEGRKLSTKETLALARAAQPVVD
jgi:hypothetical protein